MLRLPDGIGLEREERDGLITFRARVRVEAQQSDSARTWDGFRGEADSMREFVERKVLASLLNELARLEESIEKALGR